MNLTADSLQYDSLLHLCASTPGAAPAVDSLSLSYSFLVVDSSRIGGLRKLVNGLVVDHRRERFACVCQGYRGIRVTITQNDHHHKYSKVTFAGIIAGNLLITASKRPIPFSPTRRSRPSPGIVLRHTSTKVDYTVPPKLFVVNRDSVECRRAQLPLRFTIPGRFSPFWYTASGLLSGRFHLSVGCRCIKYLSESGSAQVAGTSQYEFGERHEPAYEVVSQKQHEGGICVRPTIAYLDHNHRRRRYGSGFGLRVCLFIPL